VKVKIGNKFIGDGQPTFIIAEVGSNHNQDFSLAIQHIDAAQKLALMLSSFKHLRRINIFQNMLKCLTTLRGMRIFMI